MDLQLNKQFLNVNGIRMHVVTAGNPEGRLLIFLHGFPEFWYGWHNQAQYFAERDYFVVMPDQRGYNLTDKPKGIGNYHINVLATDIAELIKALGRDKALIAGHDWGGAVSWRFAAIYPDLVEKMVILNMPHPGVMRRYLFKQRSQLKKSAYIFFFQLPFLPERKLEEKNNLMLRKGLLAGVKKGVFSEEDLAMYQEAWQQPAAINAMLNWYRAMVQRRGDRSIRVPGRITVPMCLIWGRGDRYLEKEMIELSHDRCENAELHWLDDATHWLHHEEPETVNNLMLNFFE